MSRRKALKNAFKTAIFVFLLPACSSIPEGTLESPSGPVGVREEVPESLPAEKNGSLKRFVVLGINDLHGHLHPDRVKSLEDESSVNRGGGALLTSYVTRIRDLYKSRTLILDGGDMFQGTLISNRFKGASVVAYYNLLGLTAAAVGNHEFDFGPTGESWTVGRGADPTGAHGGAKDPVGSLKARIKEAKFPFLAANIFEAKTGKPVNWARPTTLVEKDGVKIGIIGLSTPETPDVTRLENIQHLRFGKMEEAAVKWSKVLRDQGAKLVLVVAHSGGRCLDSVHEGSKFDPRDFSKCEPEGEIFNFARNLPKGTVDGIVAGHTHSRISHFVNGIPIIESHMYGHSLGQIDFFYDVKTGRFLTELTQIQEPVRLCDEIYVSSGDCATEFHGRLGKKRPAKFLGKEIKPDKSVDLALKPYSEKVEKFEKVHIAKSEVSLPKPRVFSEYNHAWGALIADAFLHSVPTADVAFQNNGGIRTGLEKGQLYMKDLFRALPFENFLEVITLKGRDLLFMCKMAVNGSHRGMQFSGLKIWVSDTVQKDQSEDYNKDGVLQYWEQTYLVKATLADGSPIKPDADYRIVINDFMGGGGDNMKWVLQNLVNKKREIIYGLTIRDSVWNHLKKIKVIRANSVAPRVYFD